MLEEGTRRSLHERKKVVTVSRVWLPARQLGCGESQVKLLTSPFTWASPNNSDRSRPVRLKSTSLFEISTRATWPISLEIHVLIPVISRRAPFPPFLAGTTIQTVKFPRCSEFMDSCSGSRRISISWRMGCVLVSIIFSFPAGSLSFPICVSPPPSYQDSFQNGFQIRDHSQ